MRATLVVDGRVVTQENDNGLRKVLTWTFIALVLAILAAVVGVDLAIRMFDPGHTP